MATIPGKEYVAYAIIMIPMIIEIILKTFIVMESLIVR